VETPRVAEVHQVNCGWMIIKGHESLRKISSLSMRQLDWVNQSKIGKNVCYAQGVMALIYLILP